MTNKRIHIFGASGSGTTTLGRALAARLGIPHFDTDDYFWVKTAIPYTVKTDIAKRKERLESDLLKNPEWVLSGSLTTWGDFAIPLFTLAVFLWIPGDIRMKRLRERETDLFGTDAVSPGGWFYQNHLEFMEWASGYDSGGLDTRNRALHEQWMGRLPCRLLRIEGLSSIEESVAKIKEALDPMKGSF